VAELEDDPVMVLMDLDVWECVSGVAAAADQEDRRRRRLSFWCVLVFGVVCGGGGRSERISGGSGSL
jgi:hypothetical protein